jgi:hypothetical protein
MSGREVELCGGGEWAWVVDGWLPRADFEGFWAPPKGSFLFALGAGEALKMSLLAVVENLEGKEVSKPVIKSTFFCLGEFWTLKYGILLLKCISADGLC